MFFAVIFLQRGVPAIAGLLVNSYCDHFDKLSRRGSGAAVLAISSATEAKK